MKQELKNCAIYTRKSTEEGLDQDFNSLDAQREACAAYITSQRSEGWKAIKTHYDDGGYSGGNMDRPALQKLIEDIKAGHVKIVVVYKIDRLTRSLMDFSKLVEVFDAYDVTFVSVTQSFNTTTSMGRLTLNMLLSFAQFEREVTGERIRDKIAASKKRGMWMGGFPPLGYQRINKKLIPSSEEVKDVRYIFDEYLRLGSVRLLAQKLSEEGYKTPVRISAKGRKYGGCGYSRGHLYKILSNPVYIGKIRHKNKIYDGQHNGIIDVECFEKAQQHLKTQGPETTNRTVPSGSLMKGLLYDCDGVIYSPTYTIKKEKRYHYYISQNLLQYRDHPKGVMARIPAHEIEKTVTRAIQHWVKHHDNWHNAFPNASQENCLWLSQNVGFTETATLKKIIDHIIVKSDSVVIELSAAQLGEYIAEHAQIHLGDSPSSSLQINAPFKLRKANNGALILDPQGRAQRDRFDIPSDHLQRVIRGAIWREEHFNGATLKAIAQQTGFGQNYISRCIYDSFDFAH